jgi:hypothetical protein
MGRGKLIFVGTLHANLFLSKAYSKENDGSTNWLMDAGKCGWVESLDRAPNQMDANFSRLLVNKYI